MRVVFAGTPEVAVTSLRALLASRHEVVAVLTRPDAPSGRGRKVEASPASMLAREAGIEVLTPVRPREPEFLARLGEIAPDCCPVTAYGALLPREALDIPRFGWVNLHFSLLPAWRGAAPVQYAVLHGDGLTGAMRLVQLQQELTEAEARALETRLLAEHQIVVPATYHGGWRWLRLSAQLYNTIGDYERLAAALA